MKTMRFEVSAYTRGWEEEKLAEELRMLLTKLHWANVKVSPIKEAECGDKSRMDWLEKQSVQVETDMRQIFSNPKGIKLRDMIDGHMRPRPAPRFVREMTVGELADIAPICKAGDETYRLNTLTDVCRNLLKLGMRPDVSVLSAPLHHMIVEGDINEIIREGK